jgi:hypothetical protein
MAEDFITDDNMIKWINEEIKNKYNNTPWRIPLRNKYGIIIEYSLVDEDDYEKIIKYKCSLSNGYANSYTGNKKYTKLHHLILNKPSNDNIIDHLDEDKLNNTKNNLLERDRSANSQNKTKINNDKFTSQYKGISLNKNCNKYEACCSINNKTIHLGLFEKEIDAAIQYDKYTYKYYGPNANNNKLISYEETLNINIEDIIIKKEKKLPSGIRSINNKFFAYKIYNKEKFSSTRRRTIEEAIKDLEIIDNKINNIKLKEEEEYLKIPILRNKDGIAILLTSKNEEIFVDDEMWYELNKILWKNDGQGYFSNSKIGTRIHRYIMKPNDDEIVDHINKKRYDNRRINLKNTDNTYNSHNRIKSLNCSSKFNGVYYVKKYNKWRSSINKNYIAYNLGKFDTEIEAAIAYNVKAIELYGEQANLNIID